MLKLQFKDQRQPAIWLVESVTSIGSDPKSHIVIKEEGVEPNHAEIRKDNEALYLSDLGTYQGTTVNGSKVKANFQLRAGDVIKLANVELVIVEPKTGADTSAAAASARSDWSIMALSGPLKGKSIPIHGSMVFGRSSSCDIQISDAHMSRRHAEINLKGGVLRLVDLQSSNGTCVNGQTVGEQVLKSGDKISFDHLTFLVAGPLGATQVDEEEDDDDEATVFRAAPIPRAAPEPSKPAASSIPKASANVEQHVSAPVAKSKAPLIIGVVVILLAVAAGVGFMVLQK